MKKFKGEIKLTKCCLSTWCESLPVSKPAVPVTCHLSGQPFKEDNKPLTTSTLIARVWDGLGCGGTAPVLISTLILLGMLTNFLN